MIKIAPTSSKIASESKKILSEGGRCLPTIIKIAKAKAVSVAVGIAQPRKACVSAKLIRAKIKAGTSMPPSAPKSGRVMFRGFLKSPCVNSFLSSSPMEKKKIAINPSFIHSKKGFISSKEPMTKPTGKFKNSL